LQSKVVKKTMIQRIQSIYLVIVVLLGAIAPFFAYLWLDLNGDEFFAQNELWIATLFYAVATLALVAIFLFKNRQNQFVLNRLNMILNLFLLGFFVYRSLNLSGETLVSEKGIGMLIPVFSIVFLVLANRAIKKDEDLVKSVDRLR
jgi:membrane protease YdiL (CAAX protease family)